MYVYDALTKVKSDIQRRRRNQRIEYAVGHALVVGGTGLLAVTVGFFVWLGVLLGLNLV